MNKYANLVGTNKIKDEYSKINTGFDKVEADINDVNSRITAVDNRVDKIITTPISGAAATQEIVDARVSAVKAKTFASLDARFEETEQDIATHKADKAAHGGVYHKNLLHNWDFRNPVNQRGKTEYTGSGLTWLTGYAVDRWCILGNATATINNEYLSIKTNAVAYIHFYQFIENLKAYYGKTLTFSVETADGQIYTKTVTLPTSGSVDTSRILIGDWSVNLYATEAEVSNNVFVFRFWCIDKADAIINLRRVKLELGTASTLANDPPADYGEQLMLCKRFFRLWTTEAARTEALKEVGLMRIPNPTLGTIDIGGTTYYYASADL